MTNEMIAAKQIVERLHLAGFPAMYAGGCVRDMLLNITPHDIDIVTLATPDEVESIFKRTVPVGKQFGVIIVLEGGFEFEVATARIDSKESDGRRPDSVEFSTFEADAQRRDLSINGMFFDPMTGEVHDFVGGKNDLEAGVIRFIGDAQERIDEDKLRMLRAVRFAARFEFDMDDFTKDIIHKNAHLINQVSAERIKAEMDKMLKSEKPSTSLELLEKLDLLEKFLPEISLLWKTEQSKKWHQEGNVGNHTMLVLDNTRKRTDDIATLWAALLHDVGKPGTVGHNSHGDINNHGHDKLGAEIAEEVMNRMRASSKEKEVVVAIVRDHMKAHEANKMKKSTLRKFVSQSHFDELVFVVKADCESSIPADPNADDAKVDSTIFLVDFVKNMEEERELPICLLNGKDLIKMGLKPGPVFKEILTQVFDMQLEGEIETVEEAISEAEKICKSL